MTASSTGRRLGVALAAAATLTLAACGSSGGNHPNDLSSFVGTGVSSGPATGTPTSTLGAPSAPGRTSGHSSSNPVGSHSSTSANGGGGGSGGGDGGSGNGGGGGSNGGGGGSHSSAPASNCTSSTSAGAEITVCPGKGLSDGSTVTITGKHFKANENLLYMQCDYKGENANNYGPSDCNINVLNLSSNTITSNDSGDVGPIKLTVHTKFKSIDCTAKQCMVTVAVPIQNDTSDNPHALIYFG